MTVCLLLTAVTGIEADFSAADQVENMLMNGLIEFVFDVHSNRSRDCC